MNLRVIPGLMLVFILGSSGATRAAQSASDQTLAELSNEVYAVYSAVVERFIPEKTPLRQIVVKRQTVIEWSRKERVQYLRQQIPDLDQTMAKRFKQLNRQPELLEPRFLTRVPVTLITKQDLDDIFRDGVNGWRIFYDRYPNSQGVMEFSRVGFNVGRTQALVYVGNQVGPLAGEGVYLMLVKENGVWIPGKQVSAWIS